jgi:hypothetical protein
MFLIKKKAVAVATRNILPIQREWVETGDARCPLACVWFALGHTEAARSEPQDPSESERTWPALLRVKRREGEQAFSSALYLAA